MLLTKTIITEAERWLGCKEKGNTNTSSCIIELRSKTSGNINSHSAYCALFVWVCINEGCKRLGIANPFTYAESTSNLLTQAKRILTTDNTSKCGSIFYNERYENNKKVGGHVGFVIDVNGNNFTTIEGNTSNGAENGIFKKKHNIKDRKYTFIHLEELDTIENNINHYLSPFHIEIADKKLWLFMSLIGLSGFIVVRKIRKKNN